MKTFEEFCPAGCEEQCKNCGCKEIWQEAQLQIKGEIAEIATEIEHHLREAKWVNEDFLLRYPRCLILINKLRQPAAQEGE